MGLFGLFGKKDKRQENQESSRARGMDEYEMYSGMRVEVTTFAEDRLLFVAKLMGLQRDTAKLYQYSELITSHITEPEAESIHVKIRGYSDHERKAVHMEGFILPQDNHIWQVEALSIKKVNNDRAFFRLDTDIEASINTFGGLGAGEKVCRLLNISVGGACIRTEDEYHEGDKFLLKVKLLEDRPPSVMYCQVLRIIKKDGDAYEYGCQFLEVTEEDQEKIIQNIFEAQRIMRAAQ